MDNISYDVYYAVRDTNGAVTLYDTPNASIDNGLRLEDEESSTVRSIQLSPFNLGVNQLVHLLVSHPGEMNEIDSKSLPLKHIGYEGRDECPREKMIDKFNHPLLTHNTSFSGTQLQSMGSIAEYVQENHSFPLSNYVIVDTRIQPTSLEKTVDPSVVFNVSSEEFHKNITVRDTELELVGYLVYVAGGHYTSNVKRNGVWWSLTDLGSTYEDMVSNTRDMSYNDATFSKDGKWNPESMLPQSYPVVLIYKNIGKSWGIKFTDANPSVTKNPGTACYILSPSILYANMPELVLSLLGKQEAQKYLTMEEPLPGPSSPPVEDDEEIISIAILAVDTPSAPPSPAPQGGVGRHMTSQTRRRHKSHRHTRKNRFAH